MSSFPDKTPDERPRMDVDIVCVGFGPAMGGFLTHLSRRLADPAENAMVESRVLPGAPPQVLCYERADDLGFGVSGLVTRGRAIRESLPDLNPGDIPMGTAVSEERVLYLLDPVGASRRSPALRVIDRLIRAFHRVLPVEHDAVKLPWTPSFLHKQGGMVLSLGQFNQWIGSRILSTGTVQIWPSTAVAEAVIEDQKVVGVRLKDQGTDRDGTPGPGFLPGMDVRAGLTVIGDGPAGPVGQQLDNHFGLPPGHHRRDWAIGMKMVVELPENSELQPGTVLHTFGYPEPEIFGFLYVHPDRVVSLGIFVPSWFDSPVRTAYRYLQYWMQHPYLWRYLQGGKLRSWGAKSLQESGRRGEPRLAGDGFVRIGEGSGSTNVLTGSGVDEAWATGACLAEGVWDLLRENRPFTRENLEAAYVQRRRSSREDRESRVAAKSRDGFHRGVLPGLLGMALRHYSGGRLFIPGTHRPPHRRIPTLENYYRGRISPEEVRRIRDDCYARGLSAHQALMERSGWPSIPYDGRLLMSHQDALLVGGKVQAPPGFANHVVFVYPHLCQACDTRLCVEACSGQAITPGENGVPDFDREKCIHCGACVWNCSQPRTSDYERTNIEFRAGTGGLHSAEN